MSSIPKKDPLQMQRGDYGSTIAGPTIMFLGRLLNIPLTFSILTSLPFSKMFPRPAPPSSGSNISFHLTSSFATFLNSISGSAVSATTNTEDLTPYQFILLIMSTLLVAKHIIWLTWLRKERMTIPFGSFAVISDAIFEAIETVTFTFASVNPFFSTSAPRCTLRLFSSN